MTGLAGKIFLGATLLVVAALSVPLGVTSLQANRAAHAAVLRSLAGARRAAGELLAARTRAVAGMSGVMAGVPRFRERLLESGDRATALEQAREYRDLIGAAWVLVTDEDGILVGRTDYPEEFGRDLSNAPLVAAALAGEQSGGAWLDDLLGRMFIAVGTPLRESTAAPEGAVVAAYELDDSLARAIGAATGTDVVFFALDSLHRPVIVGSTVAPVGMDGMDEPLRDSVFVAALTTDTLGAPIEVEANGAHLIGRAGEILSPAGDLRGGFVVFRSRAAELGAFRALRRTLLLAVIPGIGLALAFAFLMERQIAGV